MQVYTRYTRPGPAPRGRAGPPLGILYISCISCIYLYIFVYILIYFDIFGIKFVWRFEPEPPNL